MKNATLIQGNICVFLLKIFDQGNPLLSPGLQQSPAYSSLCIHSCFPLKSFHWRETRMILHTNKSDHITFLLETLWGLSIPWKALLYMKLNLSRCTPGSLLWAHLTFFSSFMQTLFLLCCFSAQNALLTLFFFLDTISSWLPCDLTPELP